MYPMIDFSSESIKVREKRLNNLKLQMSLSNVKFSTILPSFVFENGLSSYPMDVKILTNAPLFSFKHLKHNMWQVV